MPTVLKTFDALQGMYFIAYEYVPQGAMKSYGFMIMRNEGNIVNHQAHTQAITAIEYSVFNNLHIFFTAGMDNQVKAWSLGPDQNSMIL